ncbi:hypothetical protein XH88_04355 [Bradyrhizobium sp. CCBAU 51627]|nr:hypothetical protein [Bradyrhizobium sp. CCBAU 51627]
MGCDDAVVTGEPLYWKVPIPGRFPSGEPASEEPASTKPKARMKLSARMDMSFELGGRRCAVVVVMLITISGFVRDALKAENGFVPGENCFVGRDTTKQFRENFNHFRWDA